MHACMYAQFLVRIRYINVCIYKRLKYILQNLCMYAYECMNACMDLCLVDGLTWRFCRPR